MSNDWKSAKTDLPSNDRPVLAVVSGRPPYSQEGFYRKLFLAQYIRNEKNPELSHWYIEGLPGWYGADVTEWCPLPPTPPEEKSADSAGTKPTLCAKEMSINDEQSIADLAEKIKLKTEKLTGLILDLLAKYYKLQEASDENDCE